MTHFPRKFAALLVLNAITILVAAALLLRSFWQPAMVVVAALFVANIFLAPLAVRVSESDSQSSGRSRSKLWFWGFALLAAACVRLAFFIQFGFSWPGLAGAIAGVLLGTLFLFIAKKSKQVTH